MLVNHHNLGQLFTGYKTNFRLGVELATPQWRQLATVIPSNTEREMYPWLGVAPGMRKWLGDRHIHSLASHKYEIENVPWEQTIGVEKEKIEDDVHGVYSPLFERMGEAAALHPDELIFGLLNDGREATSLGYDLVPFFSTAHPPLTYPVPSGHPGNQSNLNSGGSGPYWYLASLGRVLKPFIFQDRKKPDFVAKTSLTDDEVFHRKRFLFGIDARYNAGYGFWQQAYASNRPLTAEYLESAVTAMRSLKGDNGKPTPYRPTHLIVPPTLEFDALRLFDTIMVPEGSDGAMITNIHRGRYQVIVSEQLDLS
jgi:phage major head subunit gpT-like protein